MNRRRGHGMGTGDGIGGQGKMGIGKCIKKGIGGRGIRFGDRGWSRMTRGSMGGG